MKEIKHVLAPIDGSEGALRGAEFAAALARATGAELTVLIVHNLEIVMLHAMGPAAWPATVPYAAMSEDEIKKLVEDKTAADDFARVDEAIADAAVATTKLQRWGHACAVICEYAKSAQIDLIVMGSRGRSNFAKLLLGSVSSQVASHAPCPVTIVR